MEKFINSLYKNKNIKNSGLIVLISFVHFLLSIPFSFISATHIGEGDIKAFWQPPNIVFEIVWPILYALLGIICLYSFFTKEIKLQCKSKIIIHSIIEAIGQALWIIAFGRYIDNPEIFGRYGIQYFLSTGIIIGLVLYAWFIRMPLLTKCDKKLRLLYIPYALWISFATILNIQILYIYLKQ